MVEESALAFDYGEEAYEKLVYIDKVLSDRDCISGENFKLAQKWITWNLMEAGYAEEEVVYQDITFTKYLKTSSLDSVVADYEGDGLTYNRTGKQYVAVEDGSGAYVKATTYLIGMLMNTENDYLEYIEYYFPGRPLSHLKKFSALLNALLTQSGLDF